MMRISAVENCEGPFGFSRSPFLVIGYPCGQHNGSDLVSDEIEFRENSGQNRERSDTHGHCDKHHIGGELDWLQRVVVFAILVPQSNRNSTSQRKRNGHVENTNSKSDLEMFPDKRGVHLATNHEQQQINTNVGDIRQSRNRSGRKHLVGEVWNVAHHRRAQQNTSDNLSYNSWLSNDRQGEVDNLRKG
ncbi:hypothetical protein OGAPHI_003701 [Ogataea philodendri]|uniref:Uncharacterized protein n=1 Tax=Ogataea philodendri TaxID=1378263 RepID=A0A9P8P5P3_9ASCO|nr:uncharacterized protein OGAPHI_003701 [Ogataea philodendri]KAH3665515.1 hypothetical protein OGAPHI_003701 [Ogataea philodendri]